MGLSSDERQRLIESYAAGYDDVLAALEGITPTEWDAREGPGEWSPREVIHHLGDSEMDGAGRIRMIVAEREPRLTGWDADRWAEVLYSSERPVEASLAGFKGARDATLPLLRLPTQAVAAGGPAQRVRPVFRRRRAGVLRPARPGPRRADPPGAEGAHRLARV